MGQFWESAAPLGHSTHVLLHTSSCALSRTKAPLGASGALQHGPKQKFSWCCHRPAGEQQRKAGVGGSPPAVYHGFFQQQ